MGGLLLFEGEELVVRFRPSALWYLRRYLLSLLWMVPALVAAAWPLFVSAPNAIELGLGVFVLLAVLAVASASRIVWVSWPFLVIAVVAAFATVALHVSGVAGTYPDWAPGLGLGIALVLLRLLLHEADRLARQRYLTTERLVIRGGLRHREDRTITLKKVHEVRTERPALGRLFDMGHLVVVLSRSVRGGKNPVVHEDKEVVRGVGHLTEIQHHLAQLVDESHMPAKDRKRRLEERRVKDSMRRLAAWSRRGGRRAAP